eukprot:GFYU01026337.1.p1 GENE.GFYU01026337.1~~GFYU01026337.1.p1  ORF type:complete len:257 (-),score=80.49 GFYU01026337.1:2-745(-)
MDDTMKLWDLRNVKEALHVFNGLSNASSRLDCLFSPDDRYVVTGTSVNPKQAGDIGKLVFYDTKTFELVDEVAMESGGVSRVFWHSKLNQIAVGGSNNKTTVYYDEKLSVKGALLCVSRKDRKRTIEDAQTKPVVYTPHALPVFKEERQTKRQKEKARQDPAKSKKPMMPNGPNAGAYVRNSTYSQFVMSQLHKKDNFRAEDPREAILRHAKEAEENPQYITQAYAKTQPKAILKSYDDDKDAEKDE